MVDSRRLENLKIAISRQRFNRSREIWRNHCDHL